MESELKPISDQIAQGWEIVSASTFSDASSRIVHSVLMRRQKQHKFVIIRKRIIGQGFAVEERDV